MANRQKLCELTSLTSAITDYYANHSKDIDFPIVEHAQGLILEISETYKNLNKENKEKFKPMQKDAIAKLQNITKRYQN